MISMKIPVDKIREVIGSGGKTIQKICADTGAKIDIEDDGSVFISAVDAECALAAKKMVGCLPFFFSILGMTFFIMMVLANFDDLIL